MLLHLVSEPLSRYPLRMAAFLHFAGVRSELAEWETADSVFERLKNLQPGQTQAFYLANGGNLRVSHGTSSWSVEETPPGSLGVGPDGNYISVED